jgi:hypothetical protein
MDRTRFALIVVATMVAAAGGAFIVSQQLRASADNKDPIEEASDMIGECYRKMNEIQAKLGGIRPSPARG